MQGIAALQDPQLQKLMTVSSVKPQDLPRVASAAGVSYENLSREQKDSLNGLVEELRGFSNEELLTFDKFLTFISQHKDRYAELVSDFYRRGLFQEGELPEQYDENFFSMVHAMVVQTLQLKQSQQQEAPEQKMAKGGIASVRQAAEKVRAAGRDGDTILAHINPQEAALLKANGGSGTINPKTGLPEFKSFFSKIGKFLGAAAPVIGGVVGSFFGMPFLGSVLGGAVGGLASGGGVKGALMGAAMGGIGSLAFGGLSSVMNGGGFMEGITNTLPSFMGGAGESFGGTLFGSGAEAAGVGPTGNTIDPATGQTVTPPSRPAEFGPSGTGVAPNPSGPQTTAAAATTAKAAGDSSSGIFKSIMDNKGALAMAGIGALALGSMGGGNKTPATPLSVSHPALTEAEREAKYPWTVIDSKNFVSKTPQYTADQNQYSWLKPTTGNEVAAATGGRIDARGGGHLEGPGTGTSDSIKAKLSDGEFVFTAKAVRGAGKGNRMAGAKKMYELMHKFERMA